MKKDLLIRMLVIWFAFFLPVVEFVRKYISSPGPIDFAFMVTVFSYALLLLLFYLFLTSFFSNWAIRLQEEGIVIKFLSIPQLIRYSDIEAVGVVVFKRRQCMQLTLLADAKLSAVARLLKFRFAKTTKGGQRAILLNLADYKMEPQLLVKLISDAVAQLRDTTQTRDREEDI
ncbi:hypothetical protein [Sphingobacterium bambusae]|uniref:DUF304 domain-containing protein n=1 Tax=Sphingobacterium bambusae TaxID=662858 RepID=A0ABW6BFW3_9SPHI|nr:hypothetical protein [Sphingobacterium bambusae]WPL47520.1 hypothetical protein SCB77_16320 [Sphingobacterium bambusae]